MNATLTLGRYAKFVKKVNRLNKRIPSPIEYTATRRFVSYSEFFKTNDANDIMIEVVDITLPDNLIITPKPGYQLIAVIDHEEGIIHNYSDMNVDRFRKACVCNHCHTQRDRKMTVILKKGDVIYQIGRNCLSNYFSTDMNIYIKSLEIYNWIDTREEIDIDRYELNALQMSGRLYFNIEKAIAIAIDVVSQCGFEPTTALKSTAKIVWAELWKGDDIAITERVNKVIDWMKACEDNNDFQRNCRQIAVNGSVSQKTIGYLAAAVYGYLRYESEANHAESVRRSEWLGEVGAKKQEFVVTAKGTASFENVYGVTFIHRFEDGDGNVLIWKTNKNPSETIEGTNLKMICTIKEHSEYKGVKQTVVIRPKFEILYPENNEEHISYDLDELEAEDTKEYAMA